MIYIQQGNKTRVKEITGNWHNGNVKAKTLDGQEMYNWIYGHDDDGGNFKVDGIKK